MKFTTEWQRVQLEEKCSRREAIQIARANMSIAANRMTLTPLDFCTEVSLALSLLSIAGAPIPECTVLSKAIRDSFPSTFIRSMTIRYCDRGDYQKGSHSKIYRIIATTEYFGLDAFSVRTDRQGPIAFNRQCGPCLRFTALVIDPLDTDVYKKITMLDYVL